MLFNTYIPCDILKPYVRSLIISENEEESTYKVLPDTGLVIGFQYKGRLSYVKDDVRIWLESAGITGINNTYRLFTNSKGVGSVLVFFKEAGAVNFLKEPLHELFSQSISLDNFVLKSELLVLEGKLWEAKTDIARIKVVETFLISRLKQTSPDNIVSAALEHIHKSKGQIKINDLIKELNISQSPLEKRFRQIVGTSPKKYASIVRMKNVIQSSKRENTMTELGYEAGFYDQAHFIKEFKSFTGDTPDAFFKNNK